MYLTYDEYTQMGGLVAKDEFVRSSVKAENIINRMTQNRIRDETPVRKNVQYAMFDLINSMHDEQDQGGEVASMSNDGVSVSYVAGSAKKRHMDSVRMYLAGEEKNGVPILYLGVE